jgi:Flp pilus assembly protein TadB
MTELHDPAQRLWCDQRVEGFKMSAEDIRKRAGTLERKVRWRNIREYVAALMAMAMAAYFFATTHGLLVRTTFALFIGGLAWMVVQLHRRGSARRAPAGVDTSTGLRFFREELVRQRNMLRSVWAWYLAPLIPGFVVYTIGYAVTFPRPAVWAGLALLDGLVAAMFLVIWKLNVRAARRLQRMLDSLNGAE